MTALSQRVHAEWTRQCKKPDDIAYTPPPASADDLLAIVGTYELAEPGRIENGPCPKIAYSAFVVASVSREPNRSDPSNRDGVAQVKLVGSRAENAFTIGFTPDYLFSQQTGVPALAAGGTFHRAADTVRLDLTVATGDLNCQVRYTGLRA